MPVSKNTRSTKTHTCQQKPSPQPHPLFNHTLYSTTALYFKTAPSIQPQPSSLPQPPSDATTDPPTTHRSTRRPTHPPTRRPTDPPTDPPPDAPTDPPAGPPTRRPIDPPRLNSFLKRTDPPSDSNYSKRGNIHFLRTNSGQASTLLTCPRWYLCRGAPSNVETKSHAADNHPSQKKIPTLKGGGINK